tara:strand:+ start:249 stop:755 length:507 start_codon:yes stop_codon:yes gene_type:complete
VLLVSCSLGKAVGTPKESNSGDFREYDPSPDKSPAEDDEGVQQIPSGEEEQRYNFPIPGQAIESFFEENPCICWVGTDLEYPRGGPEWNRTWFLNDDYMLNDGGNFIIGFHPLYLKCGDKLSAVSEFKTKRCPSTISFRKYLNYHCEQDPETGIPTVTTSRTTDEAEC